MNLPDLAKLSDAHMRTEIWQILTIFGVFLATMKQFNMDQAISQT